MSNNVNFDAGLNELNANLQSFGERAQQAIRIYAETSAIRLQDEARDNARWIDRTGDARRRLTGKSVETQNGYRLILSHGVDYGVWLEIANNGRYKIISPTINSVGTFEIMPGFETLLNRLGGA